MRACIAASMIAVVSLVSFGADAQSIEKPSSDIGSTMGHRLLYDVYQPLHIEFAQTAGQWVGDVQAICEQREASSVYQLQVRFADLVEKYAAVELFRVGPLLEGNLRNRIFYWPDKRRVGERQLRALLGSMEQQPINVDQLASKSVAVQGFSALERLLYSASYQPIEKAPQCQLVPLIVENIAAMASVLNQGWNTRADISQAMLQPSPESDYFRDHDEVVLSVFTQIKVGLDIVLDAKLRPLLSRDPAKMRQTPLWTSQRTVAMIAGNVRGLRALLLDSDLINNDRMKEKLRIEFDYMHHVLQELEPIVYFLEKDDTMTPRVTVILNKLAASMSGVRWLVNNELSTVLRVNAGFNSEDGD